MPEDEKNINFRGSAEYRKKLAQAKLDLNYPSVQAMLEAAVEAFIVSKESSQKNTVTENKDGKNTPFPDSIQHPFGLISPGEQGFLQRCLDGYRSAPPDLLKVAGIVAEVAKTLEITAAGLHAAAMEGTRGKSDVSDLFREAARRIRTANAIGARIKSARKTKKRSRALPDREIPRRTA